MKKHANKILQLYSVHAQDARQSKNWVQWFWFWCFFTVFKIPEKIIENFPKLGLSFWIVWNKGRFSAGWSVPCRSFYFAWVYSWIVFLFGHTWKGWKKIQKNFQKFKIDFRVTQNLSYLAGCGIMLNLPAKLARTIFITKSVANFIFDYVLALTTAYNERSLKINRYK